MLRELNIDGMETVSGGEGKKKDEDRQREEERIRQQRLRELEEQFGGGGGGKGPGKDPSPTIRPTIVTVSGSTPLNVPNASGPGIKFTIPSKT